MANSNQQQDQGRNQPGQQSQRDGQSGQQDQGGSAAVDPSQSGGQRGQSGQRGNQDIEREGTQADKPTDQRDQEGRDQSRTPRP